MAKLALIWSNRHLQHYTLAFLSLASRCTTFWLGHAQKSKFWTRKWPTSLGYSIFLNFSFSPFLFLLAAVIDLLLGFLALKNFHAWKRAWSIHVYWQEIFTQLFVHISGSIRPITLIWVLLEKSFPPAAVEYRWWQLWSKLMTSEVEGQGSPWAVTAGTRVEGLNRAPSKISRILLVY